MNPILAIPEAPTLVSALMEERAREAAELRLAAQLPPAAELDTPHRFRRFLGFAAKRSRRAGHATPALNNP
jgi:hypothetical protein